MLDTANGKRDLSPERIGETAGNETVSQCIGRVASGDAAAFTELYARYEKKTHGICLRILRSHEDAEEANQDVWMRIWTRVETFDANVEGSAEGWIGRIARNRAVDLYRRKVRNPEFQEDDEGVPLAQIARDDSYRSIQDRIEISEILKIARQVLSKRDFRVFYFATVLGMPYTDIVRATQLPEGTVKSVLNRSRAELRAVCSNQGNGKLLSMLASSDGSIIAPRVYNQEVGIELPPLTRGAWIEAIEDAASDEEEDW